MMRLTCIDGLYLVIIASKALRKKLTLKRFLYCIEMYLFYLQKIGERVSEDQLHDILNEVDLNKNAQVDLGEFLQVIYSSVLFCTVVCIARILL